MSDASSKKLYTPWELDAEAIVVKIRWFGVLVGYFLVNFDNHAGDRRLLLNAILGLGVFYTLLDTIFTWKRKLFPVPGPATMSFLLALELMIASVQARLA